MQNYIDFFIQIFKNEFPQSNLRVRALGETKIFICINPMLFMQLAVGNIFQEIMAFSFEVKYLYHQQNRSLYSKLEARNKTHSLSSLLEINTTLHYL